jgi:hypothetical protein
MKARVAEMEAEAKKVCNAVVIRRDSYSQLRELHAASASAPEEGAEATPSDVPMTAEETEDEKEAVDSRSVYVGNVCREHPQE